MNNLIEYLFIVLLGSFAGTVTGIIPVLHPNNIIALLDNIQLDAISLSLLAISTLLAFSFSSIIPTILLGIPEGIDSLALPPIFQLLKEDKGYLAFISTLYGSLLSVPIALTLSLTFPVLKEIYFFLIETKLLIIVLLAVLVGMVLWSKNKIKTVAIIGLAGLLGVVLSFIYTIPNKMVALFTGLFGLPFVLTLSLSRKPKIIKTSEDLIYIKPALAGTLAAYISTIVPTLSPAISIFMFQSLLNVKGNLEFIYSLGALTTADVIFSLTAYYTIGRARNGAIVFVKDLLGKINSNEFLLLLGFTLLAVVFSFIFTKWLGDYILEKDINLAKYKYHLFVFIVAYLFIVSGPIGVLLSLIAMVLGLLAIEWEVNFSVLSSVLMVPFILSLLGII